MTEEATDKTILTYRQLIWLRFRRHRLAMLGGIMLIFLYSVSILCGFFSPYPPQDRVPRYLNAPPQRVRIIGPDGLQRPFVYGLTLKVDSAKYERHYSVNKDAVYPVHFFVRGKSYNFLGLVETNIHFLGIDNKLHEGQTGSIFLLGSDKLGRDMLSRILHGARITLSLGLVGVSLSFMLGCFFGCISGYYGGWVDYIIQRVIEFIICIPQLPLWMVLSAALPVDWSPMKIYFGISIVLSLVGWCHLARVMRGQIMQVRDQDFVTAARVAGASDFWIIFRHLLPTTMSYLIVSLSTAIPAMILGETALSFLGLGIKAPAVSLGTLLQDAQNLNALTGHPWILAPGVFVILTVVTFNFLGDGLRDALDTNRK